jgi:hypothetical protein
MIVQGLTTVFLYNILNGSENLSVGSPYTYKLALYTADASLSNSTLAYTTTNEVVGSGYTAGGIALSSIGTSYDTIANVAYASFADALWSPASFTCRGGVIYNGNTGASVCVLDFGSDKTATSFFKVTFPANNAFNAIIRLV